MKNMKKILALVVAVLMLMSSVAALAANPEPTEFPHGNFNSTPESTISVSNVTAGDAVAYYHLLKWDPEEAYDREATTGRLPASATSYGWVFVSDAIETALSATGVELTIADLVDGITEAEATKIANAVGSMSATGPMVQGDADAAGNATYTKTPVDPGLYYVKITPASTNKDWVYNPVFVSADYFDGNNTIAVSETSMIGSSAVAKKSPVPFEKKVTGTDLYNDVKIGDVIPYKITTQIPSYGTTFTNPQFAITDVLSSGLTLEGDITVKYGSTTTTASNDDVTITKGTPSNGYTVEFKSSYLTGLNGAMPAVEITYSAKVTTEALNNVTYMDNKATLKFSQTPTETKSKDDITRHYTFSIDGLLNGNANERTHEIIKVGVDQDGNPITQDTTTYHDKPYSPLAGATYNLKGVANTATAGIDLKYTTLADGHIVFNGLDAGEYTLEETAAPAGYIRDTRIYKIIIDAQYVNEAGEDIADNSDDRGILKSYNIAIKNPDESAYGAASFNIINNSTPADASDDTSGPESATNPFNNTRGVELPSTGGMGTTILYIGGSILVLAAAILLITKRRMNAED